MFENSAKTDNFNSLLKFTKNHSYVAITGCKNTPICQEINDCKNDCKFFGNAHFTSSPKTIKYAKNENNEYVALEYFLKEGPKNPNAVQGLVIWRTYVPLVFKNNKSSYKIRGELSPTLYDLATRLGEKY